MSLDLKNATLLLDGKPIGNFSSVSYEIESEPASPDEQRMLDEDAALIDRTNAVRDEFLAEHGGSFKIAPDSDPGHEPPPAGVTTPSRLREYFRARGVDITATLERGKLLVHPNHPSPNIGVSLRKVDE